MTIAVIALALALAGSAGAIVAGVMRLARELEKGARLEVECRRAADDAERAMAFAADHQAALEAERAAHAEDTARLERVVRDLKAEIAGLEGDIDACQDPSVVRDRLRRLLALPEAGRAAGATGGADSGAAESGVRPAGGT